MDKISWQGTLLSTQKASFDRRCTVAYCCTFRLSTLHLQHKELPTTELWELKILCWRDFFEVELKKSLSPLVLTKQFCWVFKLWNLPQFLGKRKPRHQASPNAMIFWENTFWKVTCDFHAKSVTDRPKQEMGQLSVCVTLSESKLQFQFLQMLIVTKFIFILLWKFLLWHKNHETIEWTLIALHGLSLLDHWHWCFFVWQMQLNPIFPFKVTNCPD